MSQRFVRLAEKNRARVRIVIDGNPPSGFAAQLKPFGVETEFLPKADALIPQVGAASIIAKTTRSALMTELHQSYPMYGWAGNDHSHGNDGYGTEAHMEAICIYGVCEYHRRLEPLRQAFKEYDSGNSHFSRRD